MLLNATSQSGNDKLLFLTWPLTYSHTLPKRLTLSRLRHPWCGETSHDRDIYQGNYMSNSTDISNLNPASVQVANDGDCESTQSMILISMASLFLGVKRWSEWPWQLAVRELT